MKGQKIIFPAIASVVFSLIFVLNYSSIYADESIVDVQLTVPETTPFGENAEIVISSHSDTVVDRAVVNAEHKLIKAINDAETARDKADDKKDERDQAIVDGDVRKALRLDRQFDRLDAKATDKEDNLCNVAFTQQAKLDASGKSSDLINDFISDNSC